jgi:hypothetical protein
MKNNGIPKNQCAVCGKFAKWEDLRLEKFTPDTEYSIETYEYWHKKECRTAHNKPKDKTD